MYNSMDNLILAIRELRHALSVLTSPTLSVPFIAVVGTQSGNKYSVIELMIGRNFLPKGIESQRPIIINLRNLPLGSDFATLNSSPEKKYTNFNSVRTALATQMADNEATSSISLTIHTTRFIDITIIIYPESNIDFETISKPNCILLLVASENIEIFDEMKKLDSYNERMIGVITKGTYMNSDCINISNEIINKKKLVSDKENLFQSIEVKKEMNNKDLLMERLCNVIKRLIKRTLPNYKLKLTEILHQKHKELEDLKPKTSNPNISTVLKVISKFVELYKASIDGISVNSNITEIESGARINLIFQQILESRIEEIDALEGLTDEAIGISITNARSVHPSFFIPEKSFESLVRKQIKLLLEPSLLCMQMVNKELEDRIIKCQIPEFSIYKLLQDQVKSVMLGYLKKCLRKTEKMIMNIMKIEYDHINILHPNIRPVTRAILSTHHHKKNLVKGEEVKSTSVVSNKGEIEAVKQLLIAYMNVVKKNVTDLVLKSIVVLLVEKSKEGAQQELVATLYNEEMEALMIKDVEFVKKQKECNKSVERIKSSINDFNQLIHKHFK